MLSCEQTKKKKKKDELLVWICGFLRDAPGFTERLCGGDVSDAVSGGSALKHGSWHSRTFTSGRWFMLPLTTHTYGTGFHSAWGGG